MELKEINEKTPFFVEGINIDAPKDFVFKFISQYEKHGLWIEGLKEETHTDVEGFVGSTFTEKIKKYGIEDEYSGKILAYEDGKMYQIEIGDKWVDFKIEYDVEEIDSEKTHLIQTAWTLKGTSLHKLFNFFNRKVLRSQMEKLKAAAEDEYKKIK